MRFVKFQTLTFIPTRDHFKRSPTKTVDDREGTPVFRNTYVAVDKIMSVYETTHPQIEVRDYQKRPLHIIPSNTTAVRMVDGTIYHLTSSVDAVIMVLEDPEYNNVVLR